MSWNYRILAETYHRASEGEVEYLTPPEEGEETEYYFQIHEVYYDKDGKAESHTVNPCSIISEQGKDGIRWVLEQMLKALDRPILDKENFPNEFKEDKNG